MKILGINISRKDRQPLKEQKKQPPTLIMGLAKYSKDHSTFPLKVIYVNPKNFASQPILKTTVGQFVTVAEDVEGWLRETYGAADYKIGIFNHKGEEVGIYDVPVGGQKAFRPAGVGGPADPNNDPSRKSGKVSEIIELFTAVKTLSPEPDNTFKEVMVEYMKSAMAGNGPSKVEELFHEMVVAQFNNNQSMKETEIDRIKSTLELTQLLAPKVPTDDIASSLIQSAPALLTAFASMRGGGGPAVNVMAPMAALPPSPAAGGIDMNALATLAQSLPDNIIASLPADQRNAIAQLKNSQAGVSLPRPGSGEPTAPGTGSVSETSVAPRSETPPVPSPPSAQDYTGMVDSMVDGIRGDLRSGVPDTEVAKKILSMITWARGFTSEEPHRLLAGIMSATDETGEREFRRFCAAIPELHQSPERIDSIGVEIMELIKSGVQSTIESIEQATAENAEADPNALAFDYATTAEQENANDVSRSTGLPETGGRRGILGRDADRNTGEETYQDDPELKAEAV